MSVLYLGALLALAGRPRRCWTAASGSRSGPTPAGPRLTVGIGVVGFLLWDGIGLVLGIFARGDSPHMTGLLLAPELPVEEAFFLALLCYTALLDVARRWSAWRR